MHNPFQSHPGKNAMTTSLLYFCPEDLRRLGQDLLLSEGLPLDDAKIVADGLVSANLRGLDSHGVSRIPMYLTRLRKGVVNPRPAIRVHGVTAAASWVDGDDGMGFMVGRRAMAAAIEHASAVGIGLVAARRSTHYGMASLYVQQAIEAGYISLALTNSSPALPVWGGRTAFLGASPLAAGVPAGEEASYVLDMAMTVIARGKIRLSAVHGQPIPEGLALDAEGSPTTDARKAFEGVCLPFGGHKGAALSMLMDLLAGVLTGAGFGGEVKSLYFDHSQPQNVGHLFIAIRPDLFMERTVFETRMDEFIKRAKASPRAQGVDEILMPGEPEERTAMIRRKTGIPVSTDIVAHLQAEADRAGVMVPDARTAPTVLQMFQ